MAGAEHQLVGEREREVVAREGVEVDRARPTLLVAGVQLAEVAVVHDGVAHAPAGEVHHRVADVTELEVEHGRDAAALVVELPGVPHDRRPPAASSRQVAAQPAEAELHEWLGMAGGRPEHRLIAVEADEAQRRPPGRVPAIAASANGCTGSACEAGEDLA